MKYRPARKASRKEETDDGSSSGSRSPTAGNKERPGDDSSARTSHGARPDASQQASAEASSNETGNADATYVNYDPGPDREELSARYGLRVGAGEARRLKRLESEYGSTRVQRWADEGMPVEAMGKPRDMKAFRARQRENSDQDPSSGDGETSGTTSGVGGSGQTGGAQATDAVRNVVSSSGQSLDEPVQREMESKMGGEFSDVAVHTGSDAAAAAESINARAFTVGSDVAFNAGEYQPDTTEGKKVLAHELTHVRQQTDGRVRLLHEAGGDPSAAGTRTGVSTRVQPKLAVSSPDDPAEKEARRVAERVVSTDAPRGHGVTDSSATAAGETHSQGGSVSTRRVASERVQRGVFGDVADAAESAAESVADTAESAAESVKEAGESVVESAGQAVDAISEGVSDLGEQAWSMLETGGQQVWDALKSRGDAVVNLIREGGQRAWNILQQGGQQVWEVLQNAGGQVWTVLKNGGQQLWDLLQRNQQLLVSMLRKAGQTAWSILKGGGQQLWSVLQNAGGQVWSILQNAGQRFWNLVKSDSNFFLNMLRNGGARVWDILGNAGNQLWRVVQNTGGQIWGILRSKGQQLWSLLKRNQQFLLQMIRNGGQQALSILKNGGRQVWQVFQNAGGMVWSALQSTGRRLWSLLQHNQALFVSMVGLGGGTAWQVLKNGGARLWSVLEQTGERVWSVLANTGDRLWSLLENNKNILVNIIKGAGQRAWQTVKNGANRLWPILKDAGSRVWNVLIHTGQRLTDLITSDDRFLLNMIRNGGSRVFGILADSGRRLWNVFRSYGPAIWDILKQTGQRLWDLLEQSTSLLVNVLRNGSQRAWDILKRRGEQLWTILQNSGQRVRNVFLRTGQRLWDLLERNAPLFTRILRQGWQQFWALVERSKRQFWNLLNTVVSSDIVQALLSAGQKFISFLTRGLDRVADLIKTVGQYAGLVIRTSLQQFAYFVVQTPKRVVRLVTEFVEGDILAFGEWLWAGLRQLVSDPSGMEAWLASGAEGEGRPARMLASIVDVLPAAELWAYISTLFRGARQPENVSELRPVIGDAVTYENVRIVENSELSGRAFVTGHVINLPPSDSNPSPGSASFRTLVHEFVHVGQYETVGTRYMPEAIHAQNSGMGYNYRLEDLENESFDSFNREQQASILGDFYGHVKYSVSEGPDLLIDGEVTRSGTTVTSVDEYFAQYENLYPNGGPFERHRDEFQAGRL